ncbi:MAG: hypothetical protein F6J87_14685 [Spirulina sp. SIO3F2]|nr:hypothetical protein [Spirulina sp. SIO3F2]
MDTKKTFIKFDPHKMGQYWQKSSCECHYQYRGWKIEFCKPNSSIVSVTLLSPSEESFGHFFDRKPLEYQGKIYRRIYDSDETLLLEAVKVWIDKQSSPLWKLQSTWPNLVWQELSVNGYPGYVGRLNKDKDANFRSCPKVIAWHDETDQWRVEIRIGSFGTIAEADLDEAITKAKTDLEPYLAFFPQFNE